jgi:hypothetical protein
MGFFLSPDRCPRLLVSIAWITERTGTLRRTRPDTGDFAHVFFKFFSGIRTAAIVALGAVGSG